MALRDVVYQWWDAAGIPRLQTLSNIVDMLAFVTFTALCLTVGAGGLVLAASGWSWPVFAQVLSIAVGELMLAGSLLGLSVVFDRYNSYLYYQRQREALREAQEQQPGPPQEHDVTPQSNPTKGTAESRTLPDRE